MLRHLRFALLFPFMFFSLKAQADYIKDCHDGDTCRFFERGTSGKTRKVRFAGFDAPEADQLMGSTARNKLISLLRGKDAQLKCLGKTYDRRACEVVVDGRDVGFEMVSSGLAWDSPRYSKGKFRASEQEARQAGRGVWSLKPSDLMSPVCHRDRKKKRVRQCRLNSLHMP